MGRRQPATRPRPQVWGGKAGRESETEDDYMVEKKHAPLTYDATTIGEQTRPSLVSTSSFLAGGGGAAEPPEPEAIGSTDVCVHSSVVAVSYVFVYSVIK